ncbi:MAG: hypothetical protein PHG85_02365, partial [Candidatus Altiarchaeota archaeon]|nr:hypothetical protein [Candidatus Altiarchaeota archaeon]
SAQTTNPYTSSAQTTNGLDSNNICIAYNEYTGDIEVGNPDSPAIGLGTPSGGVKYTIVYAPEANSLHDLEGIALVTDIDCSTLTKYTSIGGGIITPKMDSGFDRSKNMYFVVVAAPDFSSPYFFSFSASISDTKIYNKRKLSKDEKELYEKYLNQYQSLINQYTQLQNMRSKSQVDTRSEEERQGTPSWRPWYLGGTRDKTVKA